MCKISIVIPIYNGEQYISRCLDSLLAQTYKNIEIVCVNDGSSDKTMDILQKYKTLDERVVIIDKKNGGVSSARNLGISQSTGNYITFVDADDWIDVNTIDALYNALINNNVDCVRYNYYINYEYDINHSKGNMSELANKLIYAKDDNFGTLVIDKLIDGSLPCYVCLLLIKRELLLKTSLFKEDIHIMEDAIFYHELFNSINSVYFLDEPFYHYYNNSNSCTKSSEYYMRNMYTISSVNKYVTEIIKNGKFNSSARLIKLNTVHANMISNYIYVMYKDSRRNSTKLKKLIQELFEDYNITFLTNNCNMKLLPFHLRVSLLLVLKKKYKLLFAFYDIRMFFGKFKK